MWFLIRYLDSYKDPQRGAHWVIQARPTEQDFTGYLIFEKHFIEDWRDKLSRYFYTITKKQRQQSKFGAKLSRLHRKRVKDVVQSCIDRGLIQYSKPSLGASSMNTNVWTDHKSREFLQPLRFFNAVLKEYGYTVSFIFGAGGTAIIWLVFYFLNLIGNQ